MEIRGVPNRQMAPPPPSSSRRVGGGGGMRGGENMNNMERMDRMMGNRMSFAQYESENRRSARNPVMEQHRYSKLHAIPTQPT